jgi:transcriptional regulator with XRE-family HTH domain
MQGFDYRHAWAEAHLNSAIALQIKALREQRGWKQTQLAEHSEMAQSRISLLEDVNYSAWSINTLRRIAKAYDLRLKVSFEEFGSLERELAGDLSSLERRPFTEDPKFNPELAVEPELHFFTSPQIYHGVVSKYAMVGNIADHVSFGQLTSLREISTAYVPVNIYQSTLPSSQLQPSHYQYQNLLPDLSKPKPVKSLSVAA